MARASSPPCWSARRSRVAGTAFQGLFPQSAGVADILGASSGAALGAALGIFFSLGVFAILQALFAFVGGSCGGRGLMIGSAVRSRDPILVLGVPPAW